MPNGTHRRTKAHWAKCHVCEKLKTVWWEQRGVTHLEWVRVCADCQRLIFKKNRRTPRHKNQLDLFAK